MSISEQPRVTGDNEQMKVIIENLLSTLEGMGAQFSPHLEIAEKKGEVSVRYRKEMNESRLLMDIPLSCTPLVDDYVFSVTDEYKLVAFLKGNAINPDASPVMDILIEMFNQGDKFKKWIDNFPLARLFKFWDVLNKLLQARSLVDYASFLDLANRYQNQSQQPNIQAVIQNFFWSRVMTFSKEQLAMAGINIKADFAHGFIPATDFINHSMAAPKYGVNQIGIGVRTIAVPGPENREVFVQYYSEYDPLLMFLKYGFIDNSSNWVYSNKTEVHLNNGIKLIIENEMGHESREKLPPHLQSIDRYIPSKIERKGKEIRVNMLIIPAQKDLIILRHVLSYIIGQTTNVPNPAKVPEVVRDVLHLEQQIIQKNILHWQELKGDIIALEDKGQPKDQLVIYQVLELCELYLDHLDYFVDKVLPGATSAQAEHATL